MKTPRLLMHVWVLQLIVLASCGDPATVAVEEEARPEPTMVSLFPAYGQTPESLTLAWSVNYDEDFAGYTLYRSHIPGINEDIGEEVVSFLERDDAAYTDTGLSPDTVYYYRLQLKNTGGYATYSNEVEARTLPLPEPEAPQPSTLFPPQDITGSSMVLAWSVSNQEEFDKYELLRGDGPIVDEESSEVIFTSTERLEVLYVDDGLQLETTYWYRVAVYLEGDRVALSNEVQATTLAEDAPVPPEPVILSPPYSATKSSLTLSWSQSASESFQSYEVRRALAPGVSLEDFLVVELHSPDVTTYVDTGLDTSTEYFYRVWVYDAKGLYAESNEVSGVTADADALSPVTLYPPYGAASNSMTLTWSKSDADDFKSYALLRGTEPILDAESGEIAWTGTDQAEVLYQDVELAPLTTYHYRVLVTTTGGETALSNEETGKTLAEGADPIPTPVLLGQVYDVTQDSLALSWTQNSDEDFQRYEVHRALVPGVSEEDVLAAEIDEPTGNAYVDENLQEATTYYYRVFVVNQFGKSISSNEVSGTTVSQNAPTPVSLYPAYGHTNESLTVTWSVNYDPDFLNYKLLRGMETIPDEDGGVVVWTSEDRMAVLHQDLGLEAESTYFYRVVTTNVSGLSSLSNEIAATTLPDGTPPVPSPVLLGPPYNETEDSLALTWTQNTDEDFSKYEIYRGLEPGVTLESEMIGQFEDAAITTLIDEGLEFNTEYYYRLFVYNDSGISISSNEVSGTTLDNIPPLPVSLYPPYAVTSDSVSIAWSICYDDDFESYALYRSLAPEISSENGEEQVVYGSPAKTTYVDAGLVPGTTYYYRVEVRTTDGFFVLSNEISVTTPPLPEAEPPTPVDLYPPYGQTSASVTLTWSVNYDEDFSGYKLLRDTVSIPDEGAGETVYETADRMAVLFQDEGLAADTDYYYRVVATNTADLSSISNQVLGHTEAPGAPALPTPVTMGPPYDETKESLALSWTANNDPDFLHYQLYQSTEPGVTFEDQLVEEMADPSANIYVVTDLAPGTTAYFRVFVYNTAGQWISSNEVTGSTLSDLPPEPVSLYPAYGVTTESMILAWSVSADPHFESYTLYRGDAPDVDEDSGVPLVIYSNMLKVNYKDNGLVPETTYYYRVLVASENGLTVFSNEVEQATASLPEPTPPDPVSLHPPFGATANSLTVTWSVNYQDDFESYTVLRDVVPIPDELAGEVVWTTNDRMAVLYHDGALAPETDYYYRLLVTNSSGLTALSNQVSGTTAEPDSVPLPTPVTLGPVYNATQDSLTISWTGNSDQDFWKFVIQRSTADEEWATVDETQDQSTNTFTDDGLEVYAQYFYRVMVFNTAGDSITSNVVGGITDYDAPPAPVTLQEPVGITGTGMTLSWEMSSSSDFGSYRLYRSLTPLVGEDAQLIYESPDPEALEFIDSDLEPATAHYYRLYVVDSWGIVTGSNVVNGTTLDSEAPECDILRSHTWRAVGSDFSLQAVNCEDNDTEVADLQVRWKFGDADEWTQYTTTKDDTHSYAEPGAYWVELEVSDGQYSSTSKVPVVAGHMVHLPADSFYMGRPAGTTPWLPMEPQRTVALSEAYVDRYEVTNDAYAAFLSDGNSQHYWTGQAIHDNADGTYSALAGQGNRPIVSISWFNAGAFCDWAGKRLPTEAEWEYAAKGPITGPNYWFPWGDALPESIDPIPVNFADLIGDVVDVTEYANGVTAWDGDRQIFNMAGNAEEWVQDYYDPTHYQWANDNGDNTNPDGPDASPFVPAEPAYRVVRGGAHHADTNLLRVSMRMYSDPFGRGSITVRCLAAELP